MPKSYEDMNDQEKAKFKENKIYHDAQGKAYKTGTKGKPIRVPEKDKKPDKKSAKKPAKEKK